MKNFPFTFVAIALISFSCSVPQKTATLNPFQGRQTGCGDFIVYKLSEDGSQYISVAMNAKNVELEQSQTFFAKNPDEVEVKWRKFDGDIRESLCTDVFDDRPENLIDKTWTSGTVYVRISELELEKAKNNEEYKVTVILKKIVFEGLAIDYLQIKNVAVGWLPG